MRIGPLVRFESSTADTAELLSGDNLHEMTVSSSTIAKPNQIQACRMVVLVTESVRVGIVRPQHTELPRLAVHFRHEDVNTSFGLLSHDTELLRVVDLLWQLALPILSRQIQ